jgi:uncharacterized membrane protein (DUF2068 family)
VNWSLRACARSGHVTYAVSEPELRDRLFARTPLGDAWRCLRCGDFVLGATDGAGPAEDAPIVLRGRALRSAFILRLLAIERFLRGALLVVLGIGVLQFKSRQVSVREVIEHDLSAAEPLFRQLGWNASDSGLIHSLEKTLNARGSTLDLVAVFLLVYGTLQIVEGVGLWKMQRWGEYLAVVATAIFLPIEIRELFDKVTVLRAVILAVNIAAVVYLLVAKRLFGLRGGHAAYVAELHEDSLLEVEHSALQPSSAPTSGA